MQWAFGHEGKSGAATGRGAYCRADRQRQVQSGDVLNLDGRIHHRLAARN
jgi:hypothetical protein